jgi:hypothetical protein
MGVPVPGLSAASPMSPTTMAGGTTGQPRHDEYVTGTLSDQGSGERTFVDDFADGSAATSIAEPNVLMPSRRVNSLPCSRCGSKTETRSFTTFAGLRYVCGTCAHSWTIAIESTLQVGPLEDDKGKPRSSARDE